MSPNTLPGIFVRLRDAMRGGTARARTGNGGRISFVLVLVLVAGCASKPLVPYTLDAPGMALVPASYAGVSDERARFREIFCAILRTRSHALPDYRSCEDALSMVGTEPVATNTTVPLGPSHRGLVGLIVPGFGFDCFEEWLEPPDTVATHLRNYGYDASPIDIEGLSSTRRNASLVRDALMALPDDPGNPRYVLIGYSKGANDVLEAVTAFPEIHSRLAAVVSIAGSIGGSPLANDIEQQLAERLRYFPGAKCTQGDRGAVASLQPATCQTWLTNHALPQDIPYYSLVTLPEEKRVSRLLKSSYKKLAQIDTRNDGQVLFYDQVIPGSSLIGYVNADHWAVAVPIARAHGMIGKLFVTQNAYPREALMEAIFRFIEEDLDERELRTARKSKSVPTTLTSHGRQR